MVQYFPSITGSLTVNGNLIISGSISTSGSITISGSVASASYAATLEGLGSASFAPAATFNVVSSSYAANSASLSTRLTTDESNFTSLSSSFATTSGSIAGRVTIIEGQDATTGSNNFTAPQQISDASNAISFTSTASLYTDGGLRVAKDSFVSGTAYFNNVIVYGTSSIQYITSSQVNIGSNIITVNTDTPAVRFGGLSVFDSGSTQLTGSIFWDSEKNHWVYSNPSGSSYSGGMLMSGPRSSALGDEQGTLNNYVMKGQGGDHITSSQIIDDGTTVRIPGALQVTGSTILTGALTGTNATFTGSLNVSGGLIVTTTAPELQVGATGVTLGNALTDIHQATGSLRVTGSSTSYFLGGNVGIGTITPGYTATNRKVVAINGGSSAAQGSILAFMQADVNKGYVFSIQDDMEVWCESGQVRIGNNANASVIIKTQNTDRLTISGTGAATFSSSVTANSNSTINGSGVNVLLVNASSSTNTVKFTSTGGASSRMISELSKVDENSATIDFRTHGSTYGPETLFSSAAANTSMILGLPAAGAVFAIGNYNNGPMVLGTNNAERMRIASGGNVGIGTSSPTQGKLVVSNAGPSVIANRETSVGVNSYWNASDGSVTFFGNESNHPLIFNTNNTERMRITSGGRVGIAQGNPLFQLDVFGTTAIKNAGATNIFLKEFNRETSNQTHTVATVNNTAGANSRVFLKLTIFSTSAVTNVGNAQTAYALWSADGTRQVSSVSLDSSFGGDTYVVSLAWSGDNLQMTTTAPYNYQNYQVIVQGVQRDGAIIT